MCITYYSCQFYYKAFEIYYVNDFKEGNKILSSAIIAFYDRSQLLIFLLK